MYVRPSFISPQVHAVMWTAVFLLVFQKKEISFFFPWTKNCSLSLLVATIIKLITTPSHMARQQLPSFSIFSVSSQRYQRFSNHQREAKKKNCTLLPSFITRHIKSITCKRTAAFNHFGDCNEAFLLLLSSNLQRKQWRWRKIYIAYWQTFMLLLPAFSRYRKSFDTVSIQSLLAFHTLMNIVMIKI